MLTSTPQGPQVNDDRHHISDRRGAVRKFFSLLAEEKRDILFIYLYSLFVAVLNLSLPLGIQAIITRVSGGLIFESVYVLIGMVVLGATLTGILQIMQIRLVEVLQRRHFARTAFRTTLTLMRLRFDALRGTYLPELVNRFFETIIIQKSLPKLLIDLSSAVIQILVGFVLLAFYHPFFIFLTLFLSAFLFVLFRITGPEGHQSSLKESTNKYKVAYWLEELARTVRPARLFNHAETIRQTDGLLASYLKYREKHFRILITQYAWILLLKVLVIGSVLLLGTSLVVNMQITLGQFVASELVIVLLLNAVEKLIINMDTVYDLLTGAEKLSHITALYQENDSGSAHSKERTARRGVNIDLRDLTAHDATGRAVLKNYSLRLAPGRLHVMDVLDEETINTLTDVLLASHEEYAGTALADGLPIRELDKVDWRVQIALYSGSADLLAGSVADNLRLIDPKYNYNELLLWLHRLGVEDEYLALPAGLKTPLLPGGRNLEGVLAEMLPLAIRLLPGPRLLIVHDNVRFTTREQKAKMIDVLAAYARLNTVIVFSADSLWHEAGRGHDLEDPTWVEGGRDV